MFELDEVHTTVERNLGIIDDGIDSEQLRNGGETKRSERRDSIGAFQEEKKKKKQAQKVTSRRGTNGYVYETWDIQA